MRQMWDNRLFFCSIVTHSKIGSSESALPASLSLPLELGIHQHPLYSKADLMETTM